MSDAAMTVAETAGYLGVSEATVRRMIGTGDLPAVRFGRSLRVPRVRVDAWLANGGTLMATKPT